MAWWKRALGGGGEGRSPGSPQEAARPEYSDGDVHTYVHQFPTSRGHLHCWTFLSRGLRAYGQLEVTCTVAHVSGDHLQGAADPVRHFFSDLRSLAQQGRTIDPGTCTSFGVGRLLGAKGVAFVEAGELDGIEIGEPHLTAIPLFESEVEAYLGFGPPRVLARLGKHFRHFPFPPWWVPGREVVAALPGDEQSLLGRVPRLRTRYLCARIDGGPQAQLRRNLVFREHPEERASLVASLARLPEATTFALIPRIDPEADSMFVWVPGQADRCAIAPEGSQGQRTGLCGVLVAFPAKEDNWVEHEDGAALWLTNETWSRLRDAIRDGAELELPMMGGKRLTLTWQRAAYTSPIDGEEFGAGADWSNYRGGAPVVGGSSIRPETCSGNRYATVRVTLLTSQSLLARRVSVANLAAYLKEVERSVNEEFSIARSGEIHLRITLTPGAAVDIKAATPGGEGRERLIEIVGAIDLAPHVEGEVKVEITLSSHGVPPG